MVVGQDGMRCAMDGIAIPGRSDWGRYDQGSIFIREIRRPRLHADHPHP
jgi:hypothetical protein